MSKTLEKYKGYEIKVKVYAEVTEKHAYFIYRADPLTSLSSPFEYDTVGEAMAAGKAYIDKKLPDHTHD